MMRFTWVFIATVSLLSSSPTWGYNLTGFRWSGPVRYEINTSSSTELGRQTTLDVVTASYGAWSELDCSQLRECVKRNGASV